MEKLTPVIVMILDGVEGVDRIPANLATISVIGGKSRFYNFCQKYTELNKVLSHLISQISLGAAIEAVAFDFDFTSYIEKRTERSLIRIERSFYVLFG